MTTLTDWLDQAQARADAVSVYPFHGRHFGFPDLFHVACVDHPDVAFCGERAAAEEFARAHRDAHAASRMDVPALVAALRAVLDLIDDAEAAENGSPARTFEGHPFPATIYATRITDAIATALGVQP